MPNLSITITYLALASHGGYSRWHGACAWFRPCNVDKSEWSSSGSRHVPCTSLHQALSAFSPSGPTSGRQAAVTANQASSCACPRRPRGNDSRRHHESPFLLSPGKNLPRLTAGATTSSLFLSRAIRLRVKRGAPEHRASGALTGSPALIPWPCPRHRDLAYQRRLSSFEGRDLRT